MNMNLWQLKLAARIHDPAEKALVLYRDPAGHEGGSIVAVGKALGFPTQMVRRQIGDGSVIEYEKLDLDNDMERIIEQADHWASAADRPQFPKDTDERYPEWARVRFAVEGQLIHPLTGERYPVEGIGEQILAEHIKTVSQDLYKNLIQRNSDNNPDFFRTLLAFWRFGPDLGQDLQGIGHLWGLLPADTRIPDHTIWQHLDLTSALAGAMANGRRPSLLTVSIGPVQEFIAASRSTSDLWAGSHFLSMLSWQAMRVIAEEVGPDAILFPQLRGVPVVDLWLIEQGVDRGLFQKYKAEWIDRNTDYNPLFGAALPNKFVAIVPEDSGKFLAEKIRETARKWVQDEARTMLNMALREIGETPDNQHCYRQIEEQLKDFPEVHWSLVPWLPETEIKTILTSFHPEGQEPEFFSRVWATLKQPIEPQAGWNFWVPNDGALYPAVHDSAERLLAAMKSVRVFRQLEQKGYRDSLTGEYEWLTLDERELKTPPGQRTDTLWARVAERKPSWAKKGEHLSTFGLIKRLWPTRFVEWIKESRWYEGLDGNEKPELNRYVVSTHVMALAPSLEKLMKEGPHDEDAFQTLAAQSQSCERASLPRKLMHSEYRRNEEWWNVATRLPTFLEDLRNKAKDEEEEGQIEEFRKVIENAIGVQTERYYALLLMDGDKLGAWLSGESTLEFSESFHEKVLGGLRSYRDTRLDRYLDLERPTSPARHMAISAALNGFSLDLVRLVVEDLCLGKLLYSGGDDVMAMVCVRDLPRALRLLRLIYSGGIPGRDGQAPDENLEISRGFVKWGDRLYRVMGKKATASVGAVVAHHTTPLGTVLRHLREAEQDAKGKGGRNAFSIRTLKRAGGRQDLTLPWWLKDGKEIIPTMDVLDALRESIAADLSRRVAYHVDEWFRQFPLLDQDDQLIDLVASNLRYQFKRKGGGGVGLMEEKAMDIAKVAVGEARRRMKNIANPEAGTLAFHTYEVVRGLLVTAEFLAREARGGIDSPPPSVKQEAPHD